MDILNYIRNRQVTANGFQPNPADDKSKEQGRVLGDIQKKMWQKAQEDAAKSVSMSIPKVDAVQGGEKSDAASNDNWGDFKKYMADEENERKNSRKRQAIMAIGDSLRHLGNLYYTTKGAVPQNLTSSVDAEEARYQKDRAARREDAYTNLQMGMKQKQLEQEQDYKNYLLQLKQREADNKADVNQSVIDKNNAAAQSYADRLKLDKDKLDFSKQKHADDTRAKSRELGIREQNLQLQREKNGAKAEEKKKKEEAKKYNKSIGGGFSIEGSKKPDASTINSIYNDMMKKGVIRPDITQSNAKSADKEAAIWNAVKSQNIDARPILKDYGYKITSTGKKSSIRNGRTMLD